MFAKISTKIYGVPENFMSVVDSAYYIPTDMQEVEGAGDL